MVTEFTGSEEDDPGRSPEELHDHSRVSDLNRNDWMERERLRDREREWMEALTMDRISSACTPLQEQTSTEVEEPMHLLPVLGAGRAILMRLVSLVKLPLRPLPTLVLSLFLSISLFSLFLSLSILFRRFRVASHPLSFYTQPRNSQLHVSSLFFLFQKSSLDLDYVGTNQPIHASSHKSSIGGSITKMTG